MSGVYYEQDRTYSCLAYDCRKLCKKLSTLGGHRFIINVKRPAVKLEEKVTQNSPL